MGEYYKQRSLMDPKDINQYISKYYVMLVYVRRDAAEGI